MNYYFQLTIPRFIVCMIVVAVFVVILDIYIIPWIEGVMNHER